MRKWQIWDNQDEKNVKKNNWYVYCDVEMEESTLSFYFNFFPDRTVKNKITFDQWVVSELES